MSDENFLLDTSELKTAIGCIVNEIKKGQTDSEMVNALTGLINAYHTIVSWQDYYINSKKTIDYGIDSKDC